MIKLPTILLSAAAAAVVVGAATTLGVVSADLGAGGDAVSSCDPGIRVRHLSPPDDPASVNGLRFENISSIACFGQRLSWQVIDIDDQAVETGAATINGSSVSVALSEPMPGELLGSVLVTIAG